MSHSVIALVSSVERNEHPIRRVLNIRFFQYITADRQANGISYQVTKSRLDQVFGALGVLIDRALRYRLLGIYHKRKSHQQRHHHRFAYSHSIAPPRIYLAIFHIAILSPSPLPGAQ